MNWLRRLSKWWRSLYWPQWEHMMTNEAKTDELREIEAFRDAVFGSDLGSEPNIYADYDGLCEWKRRIDAVIARLSPPAPATKSARDDLVARLREIDKSDDHELYTNATILDEAADELDRLRAELAEKQQECEIREYERDHANERAEAAERKCEQLKAELADLRKSMGLWPSPPPSEDSCMTVTEHTCSHFTNHAGCLWHTRTWAENITPTRCKGCPQGALEAAEAEADELYEALARIVSIIGIPQINDRLFDAVEQANAAMEKARARA